MTYGEGPGAAPGVPGSGRLGRLGSGEGGGTRVSFCTDGGVVPISLGLCTVSFPISPLLSRVIFCGGCVGVGLYASGE